MKKLATETIQALKDQPQALALVVINAIFVGVVIFLLWHVAEGLQRRDQIIIDLIKQCDGHRT